VVVEQVHDTANDNEDVDAEYTQFKAQIVTQKFAKLSKLGYSIGCGTVDLLRMLSVEGTSSNAKFFEMRKLCQNHAVFPLFLSLSSMSRSNRRKRQQIDDSFRLFY
jgi:hypothetical protein